MPDPREVTKGIGDMVTQGLGLLGQGVNSIAQILHAGDSAVRQVDGALHGSPSPVPVPPTQAASEEQVAQQVASLIREGGQEASSSGNPQGPGVVSRFQEALRTLFQLPLSGSLENLADMLPSPMDMLRSGLRDLRGSMALVRLANGMGTLADVQEVANYAEVVANRVQALQAPVVAPAAPPAPPRRPPAAPAAAPTEPARRAPRKRTPRGTSQRSSRRKKPDEADAAFAQAVAEELGDDQVKGWAQEYSDGKMTEAQWIKKHTEHAAATRDSLDDVYQRAAVRVRVGSHA